MNNLGKKYTHQCLFLFINNSKTLYAIPKLTLVYGEYLYVINTLINNGIDYISFFNKDKSEIAYLMKNKFNGCFL
jgi:hypothetical protein